MEFNSKEVSEKILKRIDKNAEEIGNRIPAGYHMDVDFKYILQDGGSWMDGFWPGILNLAYSYTGDKKYINRSGQYQEFFKLRVDDDDEICRKNGWMKLDHDIGFIFSLSEVARYKLTGDETARTVAIKAANKLSARFCDGGFIIAWNKWSETEEPAFTYEKKGKFIIDSMMNIPLLMWASEETGNKSYREIAVKHADTVLKYIIREDGSTYHTYNFDPNTFQPIGGKTAQGFSDESCWSRGQSWAIYGFAIMYTSTGDERYYQAFKKVCEYFVAHLGKIKIPVWDFSILEISDFYCRPWDCSAGCIAACGMLEAAYHIGGSEGKRLLDIAINILNDITIFCSTLDYASVQPMLLHGCVGPAYQKDAYKTIASDLIDTGMIYADYFYTEAVFRIVTNNRITLFWR